jgi:hypothetical protein
VCMHGCIYVDGQGVPYKDWEQCSRQQCQVSMWINAGL